MEALGPAGVLVAGGLVVVVLVLLARAFQRQREEGLAEAARRLGLQFVPGCVDGGDSLGCLVGLFGGRPDSQMAVIEPLDGFDPFGRGDSRRASNLVWGNRGEFEWRCFDYQYSTGSGKNRTTHTFGIAAARLPLWFAGLQIRPESVFDRLGAIVGWKDIQFEMEEFNRRYFVTSPNAEEAYGILHPAAMEYLLQTRPRHWQLRGPFIVMMDTGSISGAEVEAVIADVEGLVALLPPYLSQDLRLRSSNGG